MSLELSNPVRFGMSLFYVSTLSLETLRNSTLARHETIPDRVPRDFVHQPQWHSHVVMGRRGDKSLGRPAVNYVGFDKFFIEGGETHTLSCFV